MRLRNSTSRSRHAARVAPWRGIVERLEDRTLLSVDVSKTFAGMALDPQAPNFPPDVAAAVGPDHMVEAVNDSIAFFNKKTGKMIDRQLLVDFFAPVLPSAELWFHIGDPKVTYDELAGRFIVTAADLDFDARTSFLVVAVSDDSDPRGRWEMHRINVEDLDKYWGDFPQLAWDADAIYVMLDMFPWFPAGSTAFHHSSVITINKATVLDGDNSTFTFTDVDSTEQFDMQPAVMHGASPGAPMYFVEAMPGNGCGNGDFLQIWKMTDKLSPAPTFTNFHVQVPLFRCQPNATQPGGADLSTFIPAILSAAWRGGRLVATMTAASDDVARVRWYEFNTNAATPTLTQTGEITRGPGVHTYFPSIDIAVNGNLGMTFMESSTTEFVSMYVTGQRLGDAPGSMQTPVLVKAGEGPYKAPNQFDPPPYRLGDYSSIGVDPVNDTFWAANEYATPPLGQLPCPGFDPNMFPDCGANWGTWIGNFSVSGGVVAATVKQRGSSRTTGNAVAVPRLDGSTSPLHRVLGKSASRTIADEVQGLVALVLGPAAHAQAAQVVDRVITELTSHHRRSRAGLLRHLVSESDFLTDLALALR